MTIEDQIYTLLGALVANRAYPLTAGDTPVAPYIVYQNIANTPEVTLADGVPINNTRMQFDVYDKTYEGAKALAAQVVTAMAGSAITNVPLMNQDLYEPEVRLYRVQMDYSIWY